MSLCALKKKNHLHFRSPKIISPQSIYRVNAFFQSVFRAYVIFGDIDSVLG